MPTSYSVAGLLSAFNTPGALTAPVALADTASHIDANIDALQAVVAAGLLGSVVLTNGGRPSLALTPGQVVADAGVLALIPSTSPYLLMQRITAAQAAGASLQSPFRAFAVVDTAANIVANLVAIEALRDAGQLDIVRMTDAGTPVLSLSAAQVAANVNALARITSPFTITLTDPGTPVIVLPTADQVTPIFNTVLPSITTPHTVRYSGYQRVGPLLSIAIGADRYFNNGNDAVETPDPFGPNGGSSAAELPSGIVALDFIGNLGRALDVFQLAAEAGKLEAVITRDGGAQVLSLTPEQKAADALALARFSPNIQFSQIIGAAEAAAPPALAYGFLNHTVQDSFAEFVANLGAIDALARGGQLARIRFTDPAADVALSAAQMSQAIFALTFYNEATRVMSLTDGGTPTLTIAADLLAVGGVRTLLNQIIGPFNLVVSGSVSASTAASIVSENNKVLASLSGLGVADFSSTVKSAIASLQTLAAAGKLATIELLDRGVPALNLTAGAVTSNAAALARIVTPFVAGAAPAQTAVGTTASAVAGSLAGWEAQAEAGTLGAITLSDPGAPVLSLSAASVAQNLAALAAITTPFTIALTDGGTPSIALEPWQITSAMLGVLARISSGTPYGLSVTGPVTAFAGSLLASNAHLSGAVDIVDFNNSILTTPTNFASLETLFHIGHLGGITLLNGNPRIQMTQAQAAVGPDVLDAITSPYSLSLVVSAGMAAQTPIPVGRFANLTVIDTAANIQAALAALEPLAAAGTIASVQINGSPSFSLSAATLAANADVFLRMGTFSIALTDGGTPTLTLQSWQVTGGVVQLINAITTPVSVVINGPIRPTLAATLAANSSAMGKLAANSLVIRDATVSYTTFQTTSGTTPVISDFMGALKTLNDAGKIAGIDFRNTLPALSLSAADAVIYQGLASKVIAPVVLSLMIDASGLASATAGNLPAGFTSYTVRDSVANVLANLSQIQALGAAGLLARLLYTDTAPRVVIDAATLMANADAFGAQDNSAYPVILADAGTPTITLPGYQLNFNMRNDVLDPIVGNWNLQIAGRVSASLVATIEAEHNGVLSHLGLPVTVADYSYNVIEYLDELQAFAMDGKLGGIELLDVGNPMLIDPLKAAHDQDALARITTPFTAFGIAGLVAVAPEGRTNATHFTFTVTRYGATTGAASVGWSVAGAGAQAAGAADFVGGVLPSGTVAFAAGEYSKVITVDVAGDAPVEPDEGFKVTLGSPVNGTVGVASADGTILNDDSNVADLLAAFQAGAITAPVALFDTAARIDANIDAIQAVFAAGLLSGVTLTNGGRPTLAVTPGQAVADAGVLALIPASSPYLLSQRITAAQAAGATVQSPFRGFTVVDTAAGIVANLAAIEALRDGGRLDAVRMTDAGTPVLILSAAQVAANVNVLARITSPFTITLTDPGTPAIVLQTADQATQIFNTVLPAITTPHTVQYGGFQRVGPVLSIAIGADRYFNNGYYAVETPDPFGPNGGSTAAELPSGLKVIDYVGNLGRALGVLERAAEAGKLASVTTRDGGPQVLSLSPADKAAYAQALAKFSPNIQFSQIFSMAELGSISGFASGFFNGTVEDSLANVLANLDALDKAARSGEMARLRFTDPVVDIALTAAQLSKALFALTFANEITRVITLTDGGTPTLTVAAEVLAIGGVRSLLNQVASPFRIVVTGTLSASAAAGIVSENNVVLSSLLSVRVADFVSNVKSNLSSLQTLAASGKLTGIDMIDGGVPVLNLSSGTASANATALGKISSPFVVGGTPAQTNIGSTASAVASSLAGWESLAEAGTLGTISLSDSGTPVLSMSAATLARNISAVAAIVTPFTIALTDGATSPVVLAAWQVMPGNIGVLGKITGSFSVSVAGAVPASAAALLQNTLQLVGAINIIDVSNNVTNVPTSFAALEQLAVNGHLGSVRLTNANPRIQLTAAQAAVGPDVLRAITSPFTLSLQVTAAGASAVIMPFNNFANLTVVDTAANIIAALGTLEPLAVNGTIASIQIASGGTDFSGITAATLSANLDVFMRLGSGYTIHLSDAGTPVLTIQNWQLTGSVTTLINSIQSPVSVVIDGPIRPTFAASLAANPSAYAKLAPNSLVIRDPTLSYTTFQTFNGTTPVLADYLASLKVLNDAGKIAAIDFRNTLPVLSLTTADIPIYQSLAAKVIAPVLLSQVVKVSDLATATAAALPAGFLSYTVLDTVANILANLPAIQTLAVAGLLGRLQYTDVAPRVVISAAALMANADALGAEDNSAYPVILTDTVAPTITLQGYQLNFNMRNDVLDAIEGDWTLQIAGRITANLVATIEAEHNGVLAHLGLPVTVADYSYNIAEYLDSLQALAVDGKLGRIFVLDGIDPATLAPGKAVADADALARISASFAAPVAVADQTLSGDANDNVLSGGPGNDSLSGLGGHDNLAGNGGNDTLLGGAGNDTLNGGPGADSMAGGIGDDTYFVDDPSDLIAEAAAEGVDRVYAGVSYALGAGAEIEYLVANAGAVGLSLSGNELANNVLGGLGDDSLAGGGGADTVDGGAGADSMAGGGGDDIFRVDNGGDVVFDDVGQGVDSVYASTDFTLGAGAEIEFLVANAGGTGLGLGGNEFANNIQGGTGNDSLSGGLGNDTLIGGLGADSMAGGGGDDTYRVDSPGDVVLEGAGQGIDTVYATANFALGVGAEIENLVANAGATGLTLTGNELANNLQGGAGNDSLGGGLGNDVLIGGLGADTMAGGGGDDTYRVDNGGDVVIEAAGQGIDSVSATADFTLGAGAEIEFLLANAGATGLALGGNELANNIQGGGGADSLSGGLGNDTLIGGLGADSMAGGGGDDTYRVDNAGDVVSEAAGQGVDRVFATADFTLGAGSEVEYLLVNAGAGGLALGGNEMANNLQGGAGNDTLTGGGGNDTMIGGLGLDSMAGGLGDDTYYVDGAGDVAVEAAGQGIDRVLTTTSYALAVGSEIEFLSVTGAATGLTLTGNAFANNIVGTGGNDSLAGGGGADTLTGGLGNDSMAGGTGNDSYYVNTAGDVVSEAAGEGTDRLYTTVSYGLAAGSEVEFLIAVAGSGALALTGNGFANSLTGSSGGDTLDGGAGADTLVGGVGADLFSFHSGQAGGDVVSDFVAGSDKLQFVGYSPGSTFVQIGISKVWRLTDATTHATENITFANGARPGVGDYSWA
jgi:Ca2+-binding RTX toxin-like protein